MAKEKSFVSNIDKTNLAYVVAGTSAGVATPFLLREYADSYMPDGVIPGDFIPAAWNKISVLGSLGIGITSLVAGIFAKKYRYMLLPLGISSTTLGVLFGIFPKEVTPAGALRTRSPAGAGRGIAGRVGSSNITLRSAGPGQNIRGRNIPGQNVTLKPAGSNTFMQKNPQQRLAELKKESEDIEIQKEVEKLQEENKFRKSQSQNAIPLRT